MDTERQTTAADGAAFDYFGYSTALDGNTALVGAHGTHGLAPCGNPEGATHVYVDIGIDQSFFADGSEASGALPGVPVSEE